MPLSIISKNKILFRCVCPPSFLESSQRVVIRHLLFLSPLRFVKKELKQCLNFEAIAFAIKKQAKDKQSLTQPLHNRFSSKPYLSDLCHQRSISESLKNKKAVSIK